jgi:hypothetical protein
LPEEISPNPDLAEAGAAAVAAANKPEQTISPNYEIRGHVSPPPSSTLPEEISPTPDLAGAAAAAANSSWVQNLNPASEWEAWYDGDGDVFYVNELTEESSWEFPPQGISADNEPPPGLSWADRHVQ